MSMYGDKGLLSSIRTDDNTSSLVLFLPGLSGNLYQWDLVIPKLIDVPVNLAYGAPILPHPAFGGARPTVTQLARAMSSEIRETSYDKVIVVAHSVGAFVALGIARELPKSVQSVILINGGLSGVARFLDRPAHELLARPRTCLTALRLFVLVSAPVPSAVKRAIANSEKSSRFLLGNLVSDSALDTQARRRSLVEKAGSSKVLRALWDNRHHWNEFTCYAGDISTEVIFLVGDEDPVSSERDTREMAAFLPHAKLSLLEGVGHAAPLETADAVVEAIICSLNV